VSNVQRTALVTDDSGLGGRFATGIIALGVLVFVASWLVLFRWVSPDTSVLGLSLFRALGACLSVMGLGILGLGVASASGAIETDPDDTAGLVTGVLFGLA
jgi:phosphate transport system permease protein